MSEEALEEDAGAARGGATGGGAGGGAGGVGAARPAPVVVKQAGRASTYEMVSSDSGTASEADEDGSGPETGGSPRASEKAGYLGAEGEGAGAEGAAAGAAMGTPSGSVAKANSTVVRSVAAAKFNVRLQPLSSTGNAATRVISLGRDSSDDEAEALDTLPAPPNPPARRDVVAAREVGTNSGLP
ncbi:hypothetical protein T484DRAFT_1885447 [Baffinella frigidus]|nr:hypothetical protein T484DRAFT_1885447 [Cryptophyta sp. CCMP2293]